MKLKLLLLTITLTAFSLSVFANSSVDSIGVENQNGKKVILHKLKPKDNYYSIARRYRVNPKAIIKYNNNAKMTIGTTIKVPTDRPYQPSAPVIAKTIPVHQNKPIVLPPVSQPQQQNQPVNTSDNGTATATQYKVSPGETLFSIAKRFNTTVEEIINLNGLKSNTISPGQMLL